MPKKKYPNNLRHYRIKRRLTQREAALGIGHVGPSRLSSWESGNTAPSIENMVRLAGLYKISIDKLYAPLARRMLRPIKKQEKVTAIVTDSKTDYALMTDEELIDALAEMIVLVYMDRQ